MVASRWRTATFLLAAWSWPLLLAGAAEAQTVLESSEGMSSLLMDFPRRASINFAESSAKVSYVKVGTAPGFRWGGELKVLLADGFTTLLESRGDHRIPGGEMGLFLGYYWAPDGRISFHGISAQVNGRRQTTRVADTISLQNKKKVFQGANLMVRYNALVGGTHSDFVVGAGLGRGRFHNAADLDPATLCQEVNAADGKSVARCVDTKIGDYREFTGTVLAFDLLVFPKVTDYPLGFNYFVRKNDARDPPWWGGVGVFLSKQGDPMNVMGGLSLEFREGKRRRVILHAGIPF